MKAKLVRQVLLKKERTLFRSRQAERMACSCLHNHLSISGVLASHIEELWEGGTTEFLAMCSVSVLLSVVSGLRPACVIVQFQLSFYCWCSGAGRAAGDSACSGRNCWHLSSSWGQGGPCSGRNCNGWCPQITHKGTFNTWFFYESVSTTYSIITT